MQKKDEEDRLWGEEALEEESLEEESLEEESMEEKQEELLGEKALPAKGSEGALEGADLFGSELSLQLGLGAPFLKEIYLTRMVIVGTRFQGAAMDLVRELKEGSRISLVREPDNAYDPGAVACLDEQGRKLGYIPQAENRVLAALMDVGKVFYGVLVGEKRRKDERAWPVPMAIPFDLYMRDFPGEEDFLRLPLQGGKGSYVLLDLQVDKTRGERVLRGATAIRVIAGEERAVFRRSLEDWEREGEKEEGKKDRLEEIQAWEEMVGDLAAFAGHLPLVGYGLWGKGEKALQEAYGLALGRTLPCPLIDLRRMAVERDLKAGSLGQIARQQGLPVPENLTGKSRCQLMGKIYRSFTS